MSIYPVLSEYYDDLFPVKEPTVEFLSARFARGGTLLDIGCGTGSHCLSLAERGFYIVGIDPDHRMIQKAKDKVTGSNPEFQAAGMESVASLGKHFNGIYCIGNTLVHLSGIEEVRGSFTAVYNALTPGGKYIVQIVNYDRIIKDNISSLPPLSAGNVTLNRLYSFTEGREAILFEIQLTLKEGGAEKVLKDRVRLLPIEKEKLTAIAEAAGFSEIRLFGSFQGEEHSADSSATILVAQK